jgi:Type II CAAX prenyl endopeptidase Rce1-like
MDTATHGVRSQSSHGVRLLGLLITSTEVLGVFAGILLYIWRWQDTHPDLVIPLFAVVLLSHWIYRDKPKGMGLTSREFWPSTLLCLPVLAAVIVSATVYAFWNNKSASRLAALHIGLAFGGYLIWCSFQQYLTQSYFHRRLMKVMRTPHLASLAIALMFAGAHIPNPVLMVATFVGGVVFAEIFKRHPNIWPLAFVQAVSGFLLGALSPPWVIHGMRVGPGYFFYHLR